ncbi:MAG: phosphate transport system permease protein [Acidobacteriota bacterium]|nr:phosphate transport system permease protein [Acidobacteriota bacterium]
MTTLDGKLPPALATDERPRPARRSQSAATARTAARRIFADRAARWVVTGGGMAIIASILGILFFILLEVLPLTRSARIAVGRTIAVQQEIEALTVDEYQTHAALLEPGGVIQIVRLADGAVVAEKRLADRPDLPDGPEGPARPDHAATDLIATRVPPGGTAVTASTADGRVLAQTIEWRTEFASDGSRSVHPDFPAPVTLEVDLERRPLGTFAAQLDGPNRAAAAAQLADGSVAVVKREATENAFSGEITRSEMRLSFTAVPALTQLLIDREQQNLFGGTAGGDLYWWKLDQGDDFPPQIASAGASEITALSFLIGDRSLVVGQSNGSLSVWFPVRPTGEESFLLSRIHDFPRHTSAIRLIAPSQRNRTFIAKDEGGDLGIYFSTSERTLWKGLSPVAGATAMTLSPKGDGAFIAGPGQLAFVKIENPHPEISWKALFGKVFYEGYEQPEYAWQSTGGTDDFEAKLSLTPLLVGTLKGTFYSLLLAIPLGVLGAMFASQFLHPRLLAYIKPTVEIMAALPSVVLGFLAGLWLAPSLERYFPALILTFIVLPLAVWLAGLAWNAVPLGVRGRFPTGAEIGLYLLAVVLGLAACFEISPLFERLAFGGDFQSWLLAVTGLKYDQRNAVVVGLAMGFAVIPIIFAISEDAFSNVPRNLVSGSLALGANRWQTVTRVVLPTASPGIFSAIMIGFGRAIGETMIVLMATGNTPIMEMNAFNGFRTLSANIAVEIPEAPHRGTLYRTLFLAALLLFALTFIINTAAELVRQRLRRKYAQL